MSQPVSASNDNDRVIVGEVVAPLAPLRDAGRPLQGAPVPDRTLADLLAEVILRGKSPQTRKAYRADLEDFLVWLLGRSVQLPAEPDVLRVDPRAAQAVNAALGAVQRVTEADINAYLRHLAGEGGDGMKPATINRR